MDESQKEKNKSGYGNIAPETAWGRVFCIVFALVGIPLTLTVLASLGRPLVSLLPVASIERLLPKGRMKTAVTILATLSLLVSFLALGGLLFMWLDSRTFMEAFYFCFITTTTIGFGDIVPESTETAFIICCLVYILVGLALTTTVIELVQRQYASSWAEMKHLTARLHALSGPLASAMRKLAEGGAGEVEVNPELVRELRDLNVTLAEVQRRGSASGTPPSGTPAKPDPWEALLRSTLTRRRIKLVIAPTVSCLTSVLPNLKVNCPEHAASIIALVDGLWGVTRFMCRVELGNKMRGLENHLPGDLQQHKVETLKVVDSKHAHHLVLP